MFALYSYIAPVVTDVAGLSRGTVPLVLLVYGVGGIVGTALGGRLADWALFRSLVGSLVVAVRAADVGRADRALGPACSSGCSPCRWPPRRWRSRLQLRLMETAGEAQMLGAALNHSALNLANALGAWLGGLVIAAGLGYRAPAAVGRRAGGGGARAAGRLAPSSGAGQRRSAAAVAATPLREPRRPRWPDRPALQPTLQRCRAPRPRAAPAR